MPQRENGDGNDSTSAISDSCENASRTALQAAHNVDVGDYYFEAKAYRAASLRYRDALELKPDDPAIHVRLGRVLEKLNQLPQAIEHYKLVPNHGGSERWSNEAKGALLRLERLPDH